MSPAHMTLNIETMGHRDYREGEHVSGELNEITK